MRKDIKKSSYYVWFLGAVEAKGFRGTEYVLPVIGTLVDRERRIEPYKVTLHTSYKGVKIVQNLPPSEGMSGKLKGPAKQEVVKHFIPHEAITYVYQEEDIVACILLLYNPVTKCPLHVHVYRCDSVETARMLTSQLRTLVDRPDNQKKLSEIEAQMKGRTRDSESSGGSLSSGVSSQEKMTSLYDCLAAELKEKLGTGPLLLPPRDYDTDRPMPTRRTPLCYSPGSSGVGTDRASTPDRTPMPHHSSSDEEWPVEGMGCSEHRGRTAVTSARERFRDAKEKFLSLERREQRSRGCDSSPSPPGERPLTAVFRPQAAPPGQRPAYAFGDQLHSRPAVDPVVVPTAAPPPLARYRPPPAWDWPPPSDANQQLKRRSLYECLQEERRRSSHRLAREFMRRSFQSPDEEDDPRSPRGYLDHRGGSASDLPRVGIAPLHPY